MSEQATISGPAPALASPGGAQDAAAQGTQAQAPFAGTEGEEMVSIPLSKLANVGNPKDVNGLVRRILAHDALQREGFVALAEQTRQRKFSGHKLIGGLDDCGWDLSPRVQAAPAESPPAIAPNVPPFAGMEPSALVFDPNNPFAQPPVTHQDLARVLEERDKRWEAKWQQAEKERQETEKQVQKRQQIARFRAEEDQAYKQVLKELGYERKGARQQWLGRDADDVDPLFDKILTPIVQNAASDYFDATLDPDDPRRNLPLEDQYIPAEVVRQIAQYVKPILTALQYQAAQQVAQQSAGFAQAAVPPGPGSRPQKSPEDMSETERRGEAFRRAKAQGARLHGV